MAGKGRRFEKGNCANPLGAGAHDPRKRALKKLTVQELEEIIGLILHTDPKILKAESERDPTVIKTWIASAAATGMKKGDLTSLMNLLDRIIPKPKSHVHVSGNVNSKVVLTMPANGSEAEE